MLEHVQTYLRDIVHSVLGHHDKVIIIIKQVRQIFGFPLHMKVMFILYCGLLSVQ